MLSTFLSNKSFCFLKKIDIRINKLFRLLCLWFHVEGQILVNMSDFTLVDNDLVFG